ncbi:hypothetical protein BDZ89DRAFT_1134649 [Hymenopellis radicata]|nr:hypothetical protein BDZ89DRAFT_1134649 [Hymenopellis radicata]
MALVEADDFKGGQRREALGQPRVLAFGVDLKHLRMAAIQLRVRDVHSFHGVTPSIRPQD